ncbi:MAG: hypothetical protein BroJett018_39630 [Chloroflexota bacterium]|nr:MAG: hypothetical protein BroJett018_39630 [Chloroflexota bacterium]
MSTDPADDIARLAEGLQSPDFAVRLATIQALGESGRPEAVQYLLEILESTLGRWKIDRTDNLIGAIHNSIQKLGPVAFDGFYALWSSNHAKWGLAFRLMGRMVTDPRLIDLAKSVLESGDKRDHHDAMSVLGASGLPEVIPLLIRFVENEVAIFYRDLVFTNHTVAGYLSDIGEPAIPYLLEQASNSNEWVRRLVVTVLGSIGSERALSPLINACSDESSDVRGCAVRGLGQLGDPHAIPHLIPRLLDQGELGENDMGFRIYDLAAEALRRIGTPEALEAVQQWQASRENDE